MSNPHVDPMTPHINGSLKRSTLPEALTPTRVLQPLKYLFVSLFSRRQPIHPFQHRRIKPFPSPPAVKFAVSFNHPLFSPISISPLYLSSPLSFSLYLSCYNRGLDMADHGEEHHETLMEKIADKIHGHDSSSSSSDDEAEKKTVPAAAHFPPPEVVPEPEMADAPAPAVHSPTSPSSSSGMKSKIYRLFGREQPVHKVLGGGKLADVFLWRNKKISASVLGVATVIWFLFELLEYHLLTLVCHIVIFSLAVLFLWSNASTFINKSPPHIPDVHIPEKTLLDFASALRFEINRGLAVLRNIASGKDLKKFLAVVAGLWVVSVVGNWFNFLTLIYLLFVILHTVPVLYEKYEDQVDAFAEKASVELKKQYAVVDAKVLSKIPRGPLKDKKFA